MPTLIPRGGDDQIVPIDDSAKLPAKLVRNATPKVAAGAPHGVRSTQVDQVNQGICWRF